MFKDMIQALIDRVSPPFQVVSVANGGRRNHVALAEGYSLKQVDDAGPVRKHRVDTLESLLAYVRRHGDPAKTTLFVDRGGVVAVLDDTHNPDLDAITVPLTPSVEMAAWKGIVGPKHKHSVFRDAVQDRAADLADGNRGFATMLGHFKARQGVEIDTDNTDGNNLAFVITEGTKANGVNLPTQFELSIPLFLAWPTRYLLSVRVESEVDAADKDKRPQVYFKASFRDLEDAIDLAVRDMQAHLAKQLGDGWLVVAGAPKALF